MLSKKKVIYISINDIKTLGKIVIKKDCLCGGKGVIVQDYDFNEQENTFYYEFLNSFINNYDLVIEEKLTSETISTQSSDLNIENEDIYK